MDLNSKRLAFLPVLFFIFSLHLSAQEEEKEPDTKVDAAVTMRYMRTENRKALKDFAILGNYGNVKIRHRFNSWLSLGTQANFLVHYGIDGISPDPITGSGPIYEGNLWNRRLMSGSFEFAFPALYAALNFGQHKITIGQFVKDTRSINGEPWPFPNAMRGLWYDFNNDKGLRLQFGSILDISPRQSGRFAGIGESIGTAGVGRGLDGFPGQYRGNVESDLLLIFNARFNIGAKAKVDFWNYFIENVMNTVILEPSVALGDGAWRLKAMYIYQTQVNNGGNNNNVNLGYFPFLNSSSVGLRAEKDVGKNQFQLNFTWIPDQGQVRFPREWGLEPFYTFQRRTRIEGSMMSESLMFKWQRKWESDKGRSRLYSSIGQNWLPEANDGFRNKNLLPSHMHWDVSFRYEPKGKLERFWVEGVTALRFLAGDIRGNQSALINRADFFHLDLLLGWNL